MLEDTASAETASVKAPTSSEELGHGGKNERASNHQFHQLSLEQDAAGAWLSNLAAEVSKAPENETFTSSTPANMIRAELGGSERRAPVPETWRLNHIPSSVVVESGQSFHLEMTSEGFNAGAGGHEGERQCKADVFKFKLIAPKPENRKHGHSHQEIKRPVRLTSIETLAETFVCEASQSTKAENRRKVEVFDFGHPCTPEELQRAEHVSSKQALDLFHIQTSVDFSDNHTKYNNTRRGPPLPGSPREWKNTKNSTMGWTLQTGRIDKNAFSDHHLKTDANSYPESRAAPRPEGKCTTRTEVAQHDEIDSSSDPPESNKTEREAANGPISPRRTICHQGEVEAINDIETEKVKTDIKSKPAPETRRSSLGAQWPTKRSHVQIKNLSAEITTAGRHPYGRLDRERQNESGTGVTSTSEVVYDVRNEDSKALHSKHSQMKRPSPELDAQRRAKEKVAYSKVSHLDPVQVAANTETSEPPEKGSSTTQTPHQVDATYDQTRVSALEQTSTAVGEVTCNPDKISIAKGAAPQESFEPSLVNIENEASAPEKTEARNANVSPAHLSDGKPSVKMQAEASTMSSQSLYEQKQLQATSLIDGISSLVDVESSVAENGKVPNEMASEAKRLAPPTPEDRFGKGDAIDRVLATAKCTAKPNDFVDKRAPPVPEMELHRSKAAFGQAKSLQKGPICQASETVWSDHKFQENPATRLLLCHVTTPDISGVLKDNLNGKGTYDQNDTAVVDCRDAIEPSMRESLDEYHTRELAYQGAIVPPTVVSDSVVQGIDILMSTLKNHSDEDCEVNVHSRIKVHRSWKLPPMAPCSVVVPSSNLQIASDSNIEAMDTADCSESVSAFTGIPVVRGQDPQVSGAVTAPMAHRKFSVNDDFNVLPSLEETSSSGLVNRVEMVSCSSNSGPGVETIACGKSIHSSHLGNRVKSILDLAMNGQQMGGNDSVSANHSVTALRYLEGISTSSAQGEIDVREDEVSLGPRGPNPRVFDRESVVPVVQGHDLAIEASSRARDLGEESSDDSEDENAEPTTDMINISFSASSSSAEGNGLIVGFPVVSGFDMLCISSITGLKGGLNGSAQNRSEVDLLIGKEIRIVAEKKKSTADSVGHTVSTIGSSTADRLTEDGKALVSEFNLLGAASSKNRKAVQSPPNEAIIQVEGVSVVKASDRLLIVDGLEVPVLVKSTVPENSVLISNVLSAKNKVCTSFDTKMTPTSCGDVAPGVTEQKKWNSSEDSAILEVETMDSEKEDAWQVDRSSSYQTSLMGIEFVGSQEPLASPHQSVPSYQQSRGPKSRDLQFSPKVEYNTTEFGNKKQVPSEMDDKAPQSLDDRDSKSLPLALANSLDLAQDRASQLLESFGGDKPQTLPSLLTIDKGVKDIENNSAIPGDKETHTQGDMQVEQIKDCMQTRRIKDNASTSDLPANTPPCATPNLHAANVLVRTSNEISGLSPKTSRIEEGAADRKSLKLPRRKNPTPEQIYSRERSNKANDLHVSSTTSALRDERCLQSTPDVETQSFSSGRTFGDQRKRVRPSPEVKLLSSPDKEEATGIRLNQRGGDGKSELSYQQTEEQKIEASPPEESNSAKTTESTNGSQCGSMVPNVAPMCTAQASSPDHSSLPIPSKPIPSPKQCDSQPSDSTNKFTSVARSSTDDQIDADVPINTDQISTGPNKSLRDVGSDDEDGLVAQLGNIVDEGANFQGYAGKSSRTNEVLRHILDSCDSKLTETSSRGEQEKKSSKIEKAEASLASGNNANNNTIIQNLRDDCILTRSEDELIPAAKGSADSHTRNARSDTESASEIESVTKSPKKTDNEIENFTSANGSVPVVVGEDIEPRFDCSDSQGDLPTVRGIHSGKIYPIVQSRDLDETSTVHPRTIPLIDGEKVRLAPTNSNSIDGEQVRQELSEASSVFALSEDEDDGDEFVNFGRIQIEATDPLSSKEGFEISLADQTAGLKMTTTASSSAETAIMGSSKRSASRSKNQEQTQVSPTGSINVPLSIVLNDSNQSKKGNNSVSGPTSSDAMRGSIDTQSCSVTTASNSMIPPFQSRKHQALTAQQGPDSRLLVSVCSAVSSVCFGQDTPANHLSATEIKAEKSWGSLFCAESHRGIKEEIDPSRPFAEALGPVMDAAVSNATVTNSVGASSEKGSTHAALRNALADEHGQPATRDASETQADKSKVMSRNSAASTLPPYWGLLSQDPKTKEADSAQKEKPSLSIETQQRRLSSEADEPLMSKFSSPSRSPSRASWTSKSPSKISQSSKSSWMRMPISTTLEKAFDQLTNRSPVGPARKYDSPIPAEIKVETPANKSESFNKLSDAIPEEIQVTDRIRLDAKQTEKTLESATPPTDGALIPVGQAEAKLTTRKRDSSVPVPVIEVQVPKPTASKKVELIPEVIEVEASEQELRITNDIPREIALKGDQGSRVGSAITGASSSVALTSATGESDRHRTSSTSFSSAPRNLARFGSASGDAELNAPPKRTPSDDKTSEGFSTSDQTPGDASRATSNKNNDKTLDVIVENGSTGTSESSALLLALTRSGESAVNGDGKPGDNMPVSQAQQQTYDHGKLLPAKSPSRKRSGMLPGHGSIEADRLSPIINPVRGQVLMETASSNATVPDSVTVRTNREFTRSPRLQSVLDRLRSRKAQQSDRSVSSADVDPVDVDDLFSRYDNIVKHMVVLDDKRLLRAQEKFSRSLKDGRDETEHARQADERSVNSEPIVDIIALEPPIKTASRSRSLRPSDSTSSETSTPSEKARELRKQLDHALQKSVSIRAKQERLGAELTTFKSRFQLQKEAHQFDPDTSGFPDYNNHNLSAESDFSPLGKGNAQQQQLKNKDRAHSSSSDLSGSAAFEAKAALSPTGTEQTIVSGESPSANRPNRSSVVPLVVNRSASPTPRTSTIGMYMDVDQRFESLISKHQSISTTKRSLSTPRTYQRSLTHQQVYDTFDVQSLQSSYHLPPMPNARIESTFEDGTSSKHHRLPQSSSSVLHGTGYQTLTPNSRAQIESPLSDSSLTIQQHNRTSSPYRMSSANVARSPISDSSLTLVGDHRASTPGSVYRGGDRDTPLIVDLYNSSNNFATQYDIPKEIIDVDDYVNAEEEVEEEEEEEEEDRFATEMRKIHKLPGGKRSSPTTDRLNLQVLHSALLEDDFAGGDLDRIDLVSASGDDDMSESRMTTTSSTTNESATDNQVKLQQINSILDGLRFAEERKLGLSTSTLTSPRSQRFH